MSVWPTIERFIAEHGAAVLVTLAECRGSSPREAGARMMVRPDGGFSGTIGGGTLEWIALAEAQGMLARRDGKPFRTLVKALGPDLGQCCGGHVTVNLEHFDADDRMRVGMLADAERAGRLVTIAAMDNGRPLRRIATEDDGRDATALYTRLADGRIVERFGADLTPFYLFGAGHVGRSLVLALAPLPFAITWIDPRPNAFPPHIPANVTCIAEGEPAHVIARAPDDALIAVMTHSHALDLDVVATALKAKRFGYVGLIGSDTKRARFSSTLRKLAVPQEDIDRLVCPIGLTEIEDKAPAVIAASIVAQLLIVRERGAASLAHGHRPDIAGLRHG